MIGSVCGTETVKSISARVRLVVSNSLQPHGLYSLPGFSGRGISYTRNTGVGCHFLLQGDLPDPGIQLVSSASPASAGRFLTIEPPGKPSISVICVKGC